ncbi:MAG: penicillin-binding protein [Clostridiales bacterium]|nr:penicillin-binding protein [Clostridiales bacterium]
MKQIGGRAIVMLILALFFTVGAAVFLFGFATKGENWTAYPTNRHIYKDGSLVRAGAVTDRNGEILAQTVDGTRSFSENKDIRKATLHAVGDLEGKISTGVHTAYWQQLAGYDRVNGIYSRSGQGNDMQLTLDAGLCVTAAKALGSHAGAVGVYNYKTGEMICMTSTPSYDPNNPPETADEAAGLYVNRLLSGKYTPGSIFKLVTAAAAIDHISEIDSRTFTCKQGVDIDGEWVSCMHNHKEIDFVNGLARSCNSTFAQLAVEMGRSSMTKTANQLGFNKSFYMDGIKCAASSYEVGSARDIELAWSGMGQYNDLVNPFHYLTFMGAVANHGQPMKPYMVESVTTPAGLPVHMKDDGKGSRMLKAATADKLAEMMRNNVLKNYGDSNFPGLQLCGKTGTAEVGDVTPHSWFVGFCQNEEKPYAFVVVVENAGAGISVAARVANTVLQAAPAVS